MKKIKAIFASLVFLGLATSCNQPQVNSLSTGKVQGFQNSIKTKTTISGSVEFPVSISKLKTKSNISDIRPGATVSIIEPNLNFTIASGITDADGDFTINPQAGFVPEDGQIFILEATKRLEGGTVGKGLASIRTYIKWNDTGNIWTSITFPGIKITIQTTALAIIDGFNNTVNPDDLIGKIDITNNQAIISPVNGITSENITEVSGLASEILNQNGDPVRYIGLNNTGTSFVIKNPPQITPPVIPGSGEYTVFTEHSENMMGPGPMGTSLSGLSILDLSSLEKKTIVPPEENINFNSPLLLSDRQHFIYTEQDCNSGCTSGIYKISVQGDNKIQLAAGLVANSGNESIENLTPSGMPDKFLFKYVNSINTSDPNNGIYLLDAIHDTYTKLSGSLAGNNWALNDDGHDFLSPDKSKIIFGFHNGSRWNLYLANLTGTPEEPVKLSGDPTSNSMSGYGNWSPDSTKIAFIEGYPNNRNDIWVVDLNVSTNAFKLTDALANNQFSYYEISPDSQKISVKSSASFNSHKLYVFNSNTSNSPVEITSGTTFSNLDYVKWAPLSNKLAFSGRISGANPDRYDLYVSNSLTAGSIINLTPGFRLNNNEFVFNPDGTEIMFNSYNGGIPSPAYIIGKTTTAGGATPTVAVNAADQATIYTGSEYINPSGKIPFYQDGYTKYMDFDGTNIWEIGQDLENLKWVNAGTITYSKNIDCTGSFYVRVVPPASNPIPALTWDSCPVGDTITNFNNFMTFLNN
jgi:hypothetical protein